MCRRGGLCAWIRWSRCGMSRAGVSRRSFFSGFGFTTGRAACGAFGERLMRTFLRVCVLGFLCWGLAAFGQSATAIDAPEFQARRAAALAKVPDGIILLRPAWGLKHWDESGFHQDPSFYYFTGLANAHAAILALDGTKKESWLFVPPRIPLGADLHGFDAVFFDPGAPSEKELGIDHVVA